MSINILSWNIRGIMHGTATLCKYLDTCDIIGVTEHWLSDRNRDFIGSLDDRFDCAVKTQPTVSSRGAGGIALLYRKTLTDNIELIDTYINCSLAVTLRIDGFKPITVVCARLPSTNVSAADYQEECSKLFDLYDRCNFNSYVFLIGDLNTDVGKHMNCIKARHLKSLIDDRNLLNTANIWNRKGPAYTYHDKSFHNTSLIDYIPVPEHVQHSVTENFIDNSVKYEISDHFPICAKFNMDLYRDIKKRKFFRLKWNKADDVSKRLYSSEIDMHLQSNWTIDKTYIGINEASDYLINVLHTCATKYIPAGKFRPYLKPYWRAEHLNDLHYEMRCTRPEWMCAGRPRDASSDIRARYNKCQTDVSPKT